MSTKSTTIKDAIKGATNSINAKKDKAIEIVAIIDRSGSMGGIKADAIGAFNAFIEAQQKEAGAANLTVVLFDEAYEFLQEGIQLSEAVKFDDNNFVPRGMTALNDAIGKTIQKFKTEKQDSKVIMCILTDGDENASKEYNSAQIKELITAAQTDLNWQFVFLAANQDAFAAGAARGILAGNTMNFAATGAGVRGASAAMSDYTTLYRSTNLKASTDNS